MKLKNFDFYLHLLKMSTLREIQQKIDEYLAKPDVEVDDSSDDWEAFQRIYEKTIFHIKSSKFYWLTLFYVLI